MFRTVGHDKAVKALTRAIDSDRIAHAYLIAGPPQIGKMTLAMDIVRAINCVADEQPNMFGETEPKPCNTCGPCDRITRGLHTDVRVESLGEDSRGRTQTLISIDQVREVQREASLRPSEGKYRVFIFDRSEYLSQGAATALLKILEEPPDQVIFILAATDSDRLLPTISSRCQTYRLRPIRQSVIAEHLKSQYEAEEEAAEEIARLSEGRIGWAISTVADSSVLEAIEEKITTVESVVQAGLEARFEYAEKLARAFGRDRDAVRDELVIWLEWWRDMMIVKAGLPRYVKHLARLDTFQAGAAKVTVEEVAKAVSAVEETARRLDRNANARLALDNMMLAMPRIR
jgi:DNA polymerase-3 subunit delta'